MPREHPLLSGKGDISATLLQMTTPCPSSISPTADSRVSFGFSQMPELCLCWHLCPRAEEGSAELVPREIGAGLGQPKSLCCQDCHTAPHSPPQGLVLLFRIWISFPGKIQMPQILGLSSRGHWGQGHTLAPLIAFQHVWGPCSHGVGDTISPCIGTELGAHHAAHGC